MQNLTIAVLLDRARDAQGVKSDYALCKRSGLRANSVSHWRNGHGLPDETACEKLATLAGLDPDVVVAQVNAMRANEPQARAIWERIAARLSVAAGSLSTVILSAAFTLLFVAPDAYAKSSGGVSGYQNDSAEMLIHRATLGTVLFLVLLALVLSSDAAFLPAWVPQK